MTDVLCFKNHKFYSKCDSRLNIIAILPHSMHCKHQESYNKQIFCQAGSGKPECVNDFFK